MLEDLTIPHSGWFRQMKNKKELTYTERNRLREIERQKDNDHPVYPWEDERFKKEWELIRRIRGL